MTQPLQQLYNSVSSANAHDRALMCLWSSEVRSVAATGGALTVSLLIAPAGVSGRWQAFPARTPPPMRATRAAARREGHGLPAGRCGRGGRRWRGSPPRRGRRRWGASSRNATTARYCAGPRHSAAPTPPSRRQPLSDRPAGRAPYEDRVGQPSAAASRFYRPV